MRKKHILAVIGGGSIGTSFLHQLLLESIATNQSAHLEILLFEPQQNIGAGYPYQNDAISNVLNTRTDTTSAVFNDKTHFLSWIKTNKATLNKNYPTIDFEKNEFLPRSVYGNYLEDLHIETINISQKHNIKINIIHDYVDDISQENDFIKIITSLSGTYFASNVVLAIGNFSSNKFEHLISHSRYFNDPYPTQNLVNLIDKKAKVGIIGTSLSAIDVVMTLSELGHKGEIFCASRTGYLPRVRSVFDQEYKLKLINKEKIDQLNKAHKFLKLKHIFEAFNEEIVTAKGSKFNYSEIFKRDEDVSLFLTHEILSAETGPRIWQSIGYAANSLLDYIWNNLSDDAKKDFMKNYYNSWIYNRVSFPCSSAKKILNLIKSNQVTIKGGFKSVSINNEKFKIELESEQIECDFLINATGYSVDVTSIKHPLIKNILNRGIGQACTYGGFKLDFETGCIIDAHGVTNKNISVLGSLSTGTYFWITSIPVNTRLSKNQVKFILNKINMQN